jgi:hypothetical protein
MEESSENWLMSISQSMHPLGYGDSDQIDPVVAEALTTYQVVAF